MFEGKYGKIILVGIYISIFVNSIILAKSPTEIYIGYIVILLLLPGFMAKYSFPKWILIFIALLITGIFNILLGNNDIGSFLKIFIGLFFSYLFYYYVVVEAKWDVEKLFQYYLKGAYIVTLIGLVQFISYQIGFEPGYDYSWILNKGGLVLGGNFGIRVSALYAEPTYYGAFISAAFFVASYNLFSRHNYYYKRYQSLLVIVVYILTFSGLGYIGILLTAALLFFNFGLIRYLLLAVPLGIGIFYFMYNNSFEFRLRYDSTVDIFSTGKFNIGATHGSAIILYNNYHITVENFKGHWLFGSGLGSHPAAADKYSLTKDIPVYGFQFNYADANSMLLRIVSETGLFGLIITFLIIFKNYLRRTVNDPHGNQWLISNALLVLILLNLFRQGHYFLNGFPFFIWLYIYNYSNAGKPPPAPELAK